MKKTEGFTAAVYVFALRRCSGRWCCAYAWARQYTAWRYGNGHLEHIGGQARAGGDVTRDYPVGAHTARAVRSDGGSVAIAVRCGNAGPFAQSAC